MPLFLIWVRDWLVVILMAGAAALGLLFVSLVLTRLWLMAGDARARRRRTRYLPVVAALGDRATAGAALAALGTVPRAHRAAVGRLLLEAMRVTSGEYVDQLRTGASTLGLIDVWRQQLTSRKWWRRAEAAQALGLLRKPGISDVLLPLLDDPHEDVRAAAVGALGLAGDPLVIPALLARLADESRHQRVRIIEALQQFGTEVGPPLLAHADAHPALVPLLAHLVGELRLTAAAEHVLTWTQDANASVRAAAFQALGTIGVDGRAFYYVLKGLSDEDAETRGMAVRALGRAGREDALPYLEPLLHDEWIVAAQTARALRSLGGAGVAALERAAAGLGMAGELARHVLWERRAAQPAGPA
jgi:hypothetical protein